MRYNWIFVARNRRPKRAFPAGSRPGRALAVCASFAVLLGGLTACGGSSDGGTSSGGDGTASDGAKPALRIGLTAPPLSNPGTAEANGRFAAVGFSIAYAPLIHKTPDGEFEPALATSWEYLNGKGKPNTVFQLTLRKDAKFADGTPVTAQNVVKWLNYFTHSPGPFAAAFGEDPKFTAVDQQTVRVEMTSPRPDLPTVLSDGGINAGYVLGPKAIDNPKLLADATDGAGPYMLDPAHTVSENTYTYVPNPNYYEPEDIKFSKVEVKVISDPTSLLQSQVSGQLDVVEGDSTTAQVAESDDLEVVSNPAEVTVLTFDMIHGLAPALKDLKVREAINLAIDRKSISEGLFGNTASPTSSFIPSDVETNLEEYWPYEPEKAEQLLAEAGYGKGNLSLEVLTVGPQVTQGEPLVRAVAKNLEEVGVHLEVNAFANEVEYGEAVFAFKAPISNLGAETGTTPTLYTVFMAPEAPVNWFGDDKVLNKYYEEGLLLKDPSVPWKKMWERYTSQAYVVPLVALDSLYYVSDSVGGVEMGKARPAALASEWFPR